MNNRHKEKAVKKLIPNKTKLEKEKMISSIKEIWQYVLQDDRYQMFSAALDSNFNVSDLRKKYKFQKRNYHYTVSDLNEDLQNHKFNLRVSTDKSYFGVSALLISDLNGNDYQAWSIDGNEITIMDLGLDEVEEEVNSIDTDHIEPAIISSKITKEKILGVIKNIWSKYENGEYEKFSDALKGSYKFINDELGFEKSTSPSSYTLKKLNTDLKMYNLKVSTKYDRKTNTSTLILTDAKGKTIYRKWPKGKKEIIVADFDVSNKAESIASSAFINYQECIQKRKKRDSNKQKETKNQKNKRTVSSEDEEYSTRIQKRKKRDSNKQKETKNQKRNSRSETLLDEVESNNTQDQLPSLKDTHSHLLFKPAPNIIINQSQNYPRHSQTNDITTELELIEDDNFEVPYDDLSDEDDNDQKIDLMSYFDAVNEHKAIENDPIQDNEANTFNSGLSFKYQK